MSRNGTSLLRSSQWAVRNTLQCRSMQPRFFTRSAIVTANVSTRTTSKTVPVFGPTSSPELDTILKEIREKIFLPNYLSKSQQDLIFLEKNKRELEAEPVIAKIGDEEFRLQHIDVMNDVPGSINSLTTALSLMKEYSDWDVVPGILEGYNKARGYNVTHQVGGLTITALGRAGRQDILLECLRQASSTGLRLRHTRNASSTLLMMARKATDSDWNAAETAKALQWSYQVLELMEDPKHAPSKKEHFFDPRTRPEIIGITLRLAAVNASKHQGGKDVDGKVQELAKRVLNSWYNLPNYQTKIDSAAAKLGKERGVRHAQNVRLADMATLLDGMRVAKEVLGPASELSAQLDAKIAETKKVVDETYKELSGTQWAKETERVGIQTYKNMVSA